MFWCFHLLFKQYHNEFINLQDGLINRWIIKMLQRFEKLLAYFSWGIILLWAFGNSINYISHSFSLFSSFFRLFLWFKFQRLSRLNRCFGFSWLVECCFVGGWKKSRLYCWGCDSLMLLCNLHLSNGRLKLLLYL